MNLRPSAARGVLGLTVSGVLAAGAVAAPAAAAGERTCPPGFSRLPATSEAPLKAAPWTVSHGRKLA